MVEAKKSNRPLNESPQTKCIYNRFLNTLLIGNADNGKHPPEHYIENKIARKGIVYQGLEHYNAEELNQFLTEDYIYSEYKYIAEDFRRIIQCKKDTAAKSDWEIDVAALPLREDRELLSKYTIMTNLTKLFCQAVNDNAQCVQIYYTGHSIINTGDWACSDRGYVSLLDILQIAKREKFKSYLRIISDCSYSGAWVKKLCLLSNKPNDYRRQFLTLIVDAASRDDKPALWGHYSSIWNQTQFEKGLWRRAGPISVWDLTGRINHLKSIYIYIYI